MFGLVGGLLAAWALFLESRRAAAPGGRRLAAGSVTLCCYAVLAGLVVPPAAFFPARVFNTDVFLATFGLPVQLIRGLLAVSAAGWIWAYSQAPGDVPSGVRRSPRTRLVLPVALLLVIVTGRTSRVLGERRTLDGASPGAWE